MADEFRCDRTLPYCDNGLPSHEKGGLEGAVLGIKPALSMACKAAITALRCDRYPGL
ncbi:protein of unknown function [Pseudomonas marincola]|uniref:Uncharacterized protein n=1 Tax=Pseudomonas marincola TaxID=437900 RepID=A0A8S2B9T7_9PSED|nr:protein of unknown function [Pseudomonas marincola]